MKKLIIIVTIVAVTAAIFFASCSHNDSNSTGIATRTYIGTQSPGDVWTWTFDFPIIGDGTFCARNDTMGYDYCGIVSTLPNKFYKLTVTYSTEPGFVIPSVAYALEIPNTALIVKPAGSDSDVIVCVALGDCPSASRTYNLVELTRTGWDLFTDPAYDVADVTISGADVSAQVTSYLLSGVPITTSNETGLTCSGGRITRPGDPMVVGITPSGLMFKDSGPAEGGFIGMHAPAANIDLNDVVLAGREYRGVLFKQNSAVSDDTKPLWARTNGAGGLIGGDYTDFEAGTENPLENAEIIFNAQASPGIVNGTKLDDGGLISEDIVLMINRINGKYFIYGIAEDPGAGHTPELFLMIER